VDANSKTVHRHSETLREPPPILYPSPPFPFVVGHDHLARLRRKQLRASIKAGELGLQYSVGIFSLDQLDRIPGRMQMRWERIDWSLISIRAAEVLVKDVSGDPIEVRGKALVADFGALRQLTRNPVDRLVGKLK